MDRIFEAKLLALIDRKLTERLEGADEVWLKPKQLLEQFGMFSQEWLDNNGHLLPREYASVVLPDGEEKCTRWAYPKHKINRMIQEGKLKGLVKTKKTTDADATGTVDTMQS
jgi:hypothetical protein